MPQSPLAEVAAEEASQVFRLRSKHSLGELPAAARQVARFFNGRRSLVEVCSLAEISMTRGLLLVGRLTKDGVLLAVVPDNGFSDQEEAFFASEVASIDEYDEEPESRWRAFRSIVDRVRDHFQAGLLDARDSSPSIH